MFNCYVIEGVFPSTLKLAKVVPVFKNGQETQTNNYRPISLLSPFAKLFEKLILSRLNSFLTRNNVVAPEQFDFRKHHFTSMLLADVVPHLIKQKEQKLFTAIILLDLKKAFDTVDHQIWYPRQHSSIVRKLFIRQKSICVHQQRKILIKAY